jgi:ankyrin repeat protein
MNQNTKTNANIPPFPRLGEIYRVLALALDMKKESKNFKNLYRDIDRLAREGEYDWSLLPTLCQELITKPLELETDAQFAKVIQRFASEIHKNYLNLVASISLDSMSREEALPLLVEHYFSMHGCYLLRHIQKTFDGPDIISLLDAEKTPIEAVLDWASVDPAVKSLVEMAFPNKTEIGKAKRATANRWIACTQLPDMDSIKLFVKKLKSKGFVQDKNLCRWLVVARALAWLEEKSPGLRNTMRQHLQQGLQDFDIRPVLSKAAFDTGVKCLDLSIAGGILHEHLKRTTQKLAGDKAKTKTDLENLKSLVKKHDPEGRTQFHLEWLEGRWHVLSGDLQQALPFYEKAAQLVNYRGGDAQKKITEEALVIAGYLGDKAFIKQLKHRAIVFKLFIDPPKDEDTDSRKIKYKLVENWEIEQLRQQFHSIFPEQGRFLEFTPEQIGEPELPILVWNQEEIDSMKADLRNPDQIRKIKFPSGQIRRHPQLRFFASFGRLNEVTKLLEHGASVDKLDEANASALLCAIQHAESTGKREVLDLLLKQKHTKETLNKATDKKQLTPLMCAIDYGQPDVVEKLLKMGADADRTAYVNKQTPLYECVHLMMVSAFPQKRSELLRSAMSNPDMMQREVIRRLNTSGVFGDTGLLQSSQNSELKAAIFRDVTSVIFENEAKKHSKETLLQIIQLLLENGANPNAIHAYPCGRTPLMLAAEDDLVEIFDLMIKHGGDPAIKDSYEDDCMKIAESFSSHGVINYLRTNGMS